MGSKSAATSPTGSLHSTPTHQPKPQTLDPFADLGTLGASLAGLHPLQNKEVTSYPLFREIGWTAWYVTERYGFSQPSCMPLSSIPSCLILCKFSQTCAFTDLPLKKPTTLHASNNLDLVGCVDRKVKPPSHLHQLFLAKDAAVFKSNCRTVAADLGAVPGNRLWLLTAVGVPKELFHPSRFGPLSSFVRKPVVPHWSASNLLYCWKVGSEPIFICTWLWRTVCLALRRAFSPCSVSELSANLSPTAVLTNGLSFP